MRYFHPSKVRGHALLVLACAFLSACGGSGRVEVGGGPMDPGVPGGEACVAEHWCAGAASVIVTPSQQHIDGVDEARLYVGSKLQQFNLGGFGVNPLQNLPNPFAQFGPALTQPAQLPVYESARHGEAEHTYLRLLLLEVDGARVVFVTLDAIGAGNLIQDGVRASIVEASCARQACVDPDHILFGQTHTHAGADLQGLWGGVPQDWIDHTLYAAAAQATRAAIDARRRARVRIASGQTSDFNNYRRPRVDPSHDADAHLALLTVESTRGEAIAQLLQYAAHPTSINEDPRIPHADYVYGAMRRLERRGGVGLYFNGPIADASPAGGACSFDEPNAYERVRCRGEALAEFALRQPSRDVAPQLSVRSVTATLPVTNPLFAAVAPIGAFNRYYDFTPTLVTDIPVLGEILGEVQTEIGQAPTVAQTLVTRVSLGGAGGVEIATIPGEATNTFGEFIRALAETANPGATTMLLGLTQNSFGYILPEEEFSYVDGSGDAGFLIPFTGYEEFVSLGPLTAPLLRLQAYLPLFDAEPPAYVPTYLRSCVDSTASSECLIAELARDLEYVQSAQAANCRDAGAPEAFCALLDPQTPLAGACLQLGLLPAEFCGLLGDDEPASSP
ncbi:hypothetical protein [Sinimarinibacterium thermocellulolyticum]|uniref:Neutral/alkaline non-lysosomal ceramidase N-terminal domain-containing protein n=1 Tax=Sinimarinibacterium thermocellulolyticum TaxID=3170016 RepID=A0ABV2A740_9GAMM